MTNRSKWGKEFDERFGEFVFATGLEKVESEDVKSFIHSTLQEFADKVEKEIREMRIRLNEKNILVYKVEIDNYNMAIDDIVKTLNKLNITYGLNKEDE